VPADEIIFVSSVPVRVSEVVNRADSSTGPLITVTNAVVAVDGSLRLEEAIFAEPGMKVLIDEADLGINATGVISRVADGPGTNGADGFHVYFEVIVDESPASLVGASVRMTVPIESTGGSVLAVPVSAVTLAADGSSRVQRDVDGSLEYVTVEPGLSADGYVAVRPVGGPLAAGDLVVVGDQTSTPR
jgi:multidrug efflux pump subunit AcrA (membrane-fusion protein)